MLVMKITRPGLSLGSMTWPHDKFHLSIACLCGGTTNCSGGPEAQYIISLVPRPHSMRLCMRYTVKGLGTRQLYIIIVPAAALIAKLLLLCQDYQGRTVDK